MQKIRQRIGGALLLGMLLPALTGCGFREFFGLSGGLSEPESPVSQAEGGGTLAEILSGLSVQTASPETPPEKEEFEEMQAVWLSYLDLAPLLGGRTEAEFAASAVEICENCKAMGLNTLVVQIRPFADSFYPSNYFPWSKWASGSLGEALSYDPMKILRQETERQNLAFHGWINPMRAMTVGEIAAVPAAYPIRQWYDDPVLREERLILSEGRIYLNPASEAARSLIADGAREFMEAYRPDGIQIDDYFYPPRLDYLSDQNSYQVYCMEGGSLSQEDWRRENTFQMVSALSAAVHETPGAEFGVSPRGSMSQNFNDLYIDVEEWLNTPGLLDYIAPQIYYGFENESAPYRQTAAMWAQLAETAGVPLVVGLAAYKVGAADEYAGEGALEWQESDDILARQFAEARQLPSYGGVIFFRYGSIFSPLEETAEAMSQALEILGPALQKE